MRLAHMTYGLPRRPVGLFSLLAAMVMQKDPSSSRLIKRRSPIGTLGAVTRGPRYRKTLALMDSRSR